MSRIGRMPITVPAGVDVKVEDGNIVTVKGPKGTLTKQLSAAMIIEKDGAVMSVIIADQNPRYIAEKFNVDGRYDLTDELDGLLYSDGCAYGTADIGRAMGMCEQIIKDNPAAKVYLYTDTKYQYSDSKVTVVDVSNESDWNAAILNAYTVLEENIYSFYVDIACYGRSEIVDLTVNVNGANKNVIEGGQPVTYEYPSILCEMGKTVRVVFRDIRYYSETMEEQENVLYYWIDADNTEDIKVSSYEQVLFEIVPYGSTDDSILYDNTFQLFNGDREVVSIQYASLKPNSFYNIALLVLNSGYPKWDIQITNVKQGTEPALEGYDFYFFEHAMPEKLPEDGVVVLVNPEPEFGTIPQAAGLRATGVKRLSAPIELAAAEEHPITKWTNIPLMAASSYLTLVPSPEYITLATLNDDPVILVKDEPKSKVLVIGFSVHFSTQAISENLVLLMAGLFEHFMPSTVQSNAFGVNEPITVNARGESVDVYLDGDSSYVIDPITEFPYELKLPIPGVYVLQQETWAGKDITEYIYVNMPAIESNVWLTETTFKTPYTTEKKEPIINDWLIWIAAAMVVLTFAEWWLQSRDAV